MNLTFLKKVFNKLWKSLSGTGVGSYFPFSLFFDLEKLVRRAGNKNLLKMKFRGEDFWIRPENPGVSLNLWREGIHERGTTILLENRVKKGEIALDIGAHIGYFTRLFSDLVGSRGMVYAFEPEKENFKILKMNSYFSNIKIEKKAILDRNTSVKLYINSKHPGKHNIYEDSREFQVASGIKLDSYFSSNDNKEVDWIKIDTEGTETLALRGGADLLEKEKPKIIFEHTNLNESDVEVESDLNFLQDIGYDFFAISKSGKLLPVTKNQVMGLGVPKLEGKSIERNIFCS